MGTIWELRAEGGFANHFGGKRFGVIGVVESAR